MVVKERNRSTWDIPGGGIEFGETIRESIARELYEEVMFKGEFEYRVIKIHDPVKLLTRDVWQIKIVVLLKTDILDFRVGNDADEVRWVNPDEFRDSEHESEHRIYEYLKLLR